MLRRTRQQSAAKPEGGSLKMSNKEYEKEMFKLQTELVKLQEWVRGHRGTSRHHL